jgi:hypothetical protein
MRQQAIFKPVIVSKDYVRSASGIIVNREDDTGGASASTLLICPIPQDMSSEPRKNKGDVRFSMGVALAFALPAFLSLSFYAAVHSIILIAGRSSWLTHSLWRML